MKACVRNVLSSDGIRAIAGTAGAVASHYEQMRTTLLRRASGMSAERALPLWLLEVTLVEVRCSVRGAGLIAMGPVLELARRYRRSDVSLPVGRQ